MFRSLTIIGAIALLAGCNFAYAQDVPNLPVVCTLATSKDQPASSCIGNEVYARATADSLVRQCPAPATPGTSGCSWAAGVMSYRRFADLPNTAYVDVCLTAIPSGTPGSSALCTAWRGILKPLVAISSPPVTGPIVNGLGTVNLSWAAPTQKTDGSPLTAAEIGGYVVTWGTAAGNRPNTIQVNAGTSAMFTVPLTQSTTVYVALQTKPAAADGQLSDPSNEASKVFSVSTTPVNVPPAPPTAITVTLTGTCSAGPGVTCTVTSE